MARIELVERLDDVRFAEFAKLALRLITDGELQEITKLHLEHETAIERVLRAAIGAHWSKGVSKGRPGFMRKIDACVAGGFLRSDCRAYFEKLNSVRNALVHTKDPLIQPSQLLAIENSVPKDLLEPIVAFLLAIREMDQETVAAAARQHEAEVKKRDQQRGVRTLPVLKKVQHMHHFGLMCSTLAMHQYLIFVEDHLAEKPQIA